MLSIAVLLAACGWFLMSPPQIGNGPDVDIDRPLSAWIHKKSFDTARECEEFRLGVVEAVKDKSDKTSRYVHNSAVQARCIPSDFPLK